MEQAVLRANLLAIAAAGLAMFVAGLLLFAFRDQLADSARFVMPVPPLVVAAYIFVFSMYRHYDGALPGNWREGAREIALSTAVATVTFALFTVLLIAFIAFLKR